MKQIELTQGQVALVSDRDFKRVSQYHWWTQKMRDSFYAATKIFDPETGKKEVVRMHRFILGLKKGDPRQADHKDFNGCNNQRSNIRISSFAQNLMYQGIKKNNTSGYKGVCWSKQNKNWIAKISANGKRIHLGTFNTIEEAAIAYNKAAKIHHGKFAILNKIK